jgi:hypothetical protein
MTTWAHFVWLAEQTLDVLTYVWPLTGGLLASWVVLERRAWLRRDGRPRQSLLSIGFQILPATIPIVALALGALFACQNCSRSSLDHGIRHEWAEQVVNGLLIAQLAAASLFIWLARGRRWPTAVMQLLLLWISLSASIVALMSISGDWI